MTKMSAIHNNLSTSFINLAALVRHLRRLQFVGRIHLELSSYEAEIELCEGGAVKAREQDHIESRLSFGRDALLRIIMRSKESGGLVHVYRDGEPARKVFIDRAILAEARRMAARPAALPPIAQTERKDEPGETEEQEAPIPKPDSADGLETAENWTRILALVSEMLRSVDETLAKADIDFSELFRNASGFVSFEYPFLDPDTDVFSYEGGYIGIRGRLSTKQFVGGVTAALGRIMERLREDPSRGNVYHQVMHRLRVLANRRKNHFELFGVAGELQKVIGI